MFDRTAARMRITEMQLALIAIGRPSVFRSILFSFSFLATFPCGGPKFVQPNKHLNYARLTNRR